MVNQVLLAPAEPRMNINDLRGIAQGARAAQQGDLTFQGYLRVIPRTPVADMNLGADSFVAANATAGQVDLQLPPVVNSLGLVYVLKKADATANPVNIVPDGSDTIDGGGTVAMTTAWQVTRLFCDGTQWLAW